jgi:hypothetical protein
VRTHVTLSLVQASQRKTARSLNVYVINLGPCLRNISVTHCCHSLLSLISFSQGKVFTRTTLPSRSLNDSNMKGGI